MGGGNVEGEVILVRNLLVGNGINIQFDAKSYSRQEIVLRMPLENRLYICMGSLIKSAMFMTQSQ